MPPGGGGAGGTGRTGTMPSAGGGAGVPVAGGGNAGSSRVSTGGPPAGPMEAERRLTASNNHWPSTIAPSAKGFGGLPSTEINASPAAPGLAGAAPGEAPRGAMTPDSTNRLLSSGEAAVGMAATGVLPSTLDNSARVFKAWGFASVALGADGLPAFKRNSQNTEAAATRAQMMNAAARESMVL